MYSDLNQSSSFDEEDDGRGISRKSLSFPSKYLLLKRVVRYCIIAACTSYCFYFLYVRVMEYLEFRTAVAVNVRFMKELYDILPGITLCSQSKWVFFLFFFFSSCVSLTCLYSMWAFSCFPLVSLLKTDYIPGYNRLALLLHFSCPLVLNIHSYQTHSCVISFHDFEGLLWLLWNALQPWMRFDLHLKLQVKTSIVNLMTSLRRKFLESCLT